MSATLYTSDLPSTSLLASMLKEGRARHGSALRVYCENYPIFDRADEAGEWSLAAARRQFAFYEDVPGLAELREALAQRDAARLGLAGLTPHNVMVTVGATHALFCVLTALRRPDLVVLLPSPGFVGFRHACEILGLESRGYPWPAERLPDIAELLPQADRPCAVIVNSPHNPTGTVVGGEGLAALARELRRIGGILLVDGVYDTLLYEADPPRWADALPENVVVVNSFSKSYGLPGLRLGWITAPAWVAARVEPVIEYTVGCTPTLNQRVGLAALGEDLAPRVADMRRRRDYLCARLAEQEGFAFRTPPAGTTLLVRLRRGSGTELARILLREFGVLVLPGEGYFGGDPRTLRLSFGYPVAAIDDYLEALAQGMRRMESCAEEDHGHSEC